MLVSPQEMTLIENAAFSRGVAAADLMATAGSLLAAAVRQFHPAPGRCLAVCGKGNNAGDALVALGQLHRAGWRVSAEMACGTDGLSDLTERHFQSLAPLLLDTSDTAPDVILDGLLGIGARGAPRGAVAEGIQRINSLRSAHHALVIAVDIPSGLDGATGVPAAPCVVADITATIGLPKCGLVADEATGHVGRIALLPLDELGVSQPDGDSLASPAVMRGWLPPRTFDTHKGMAGRVAVVAGSPGLTGAARLCAESCVRGGAGLVTLFADKTTYPILAASCAPEVMVRERRSVADALAEPFDAIAIGPGLGQVADVETIIRESRVPTVVDADALNALANNPSLLHACVGPRLLTPHPGEMERLFPAHGRTRREWHRAFVENFPVTLLLKGSRTITGKRGAPVFYNTTGHPGMATGGVGDTLTGLAAALLAQGLSPLQAGTLGSWVVGKAAEIAIFEDHESTESLTASDLPKRFGRAFAASR